MMVMVSEYLERDQGGVAIPASDRRWFYDRPRRDGESGLANIGARHTTYSFTTFCR